jgi:molybdopterin converting factor subunit 1
VVIRVLLFGHYRDAAPEGSELAVNVPDGATVADVAARLSERDARFVDMIRRTRVAVAADFASPETVLSDGDEVAFLPPMSGG